MNNRTREMVLPSIDEATAGREAEESRKLTVDGAVDFALEVLGRS